MNSGFDHQRFLSNVTRQPGVYVMLNAEEEVLYVGKAKNLRNRLSSYFRASGLAAKTMALVARIHRIEVTVTTSETDALLLENNLIKQYQPPYNIMLKDDKSYPYIYLSGHEWPRLSLHRGSKSGKGQYFGPYPSAGAVRESLYLMQKVFKVRQCEDSYFANRSRPCLQYQIGRCSGPCADKISVEEYREDLQRTQMFLQGKNAELIAELGGQMEKAAVALEYERAAGFRDQITQLQKIQSSQSIEGESGDLDIVAASVDQGYACVHVLYVRQGRVLGSRSYYPKCQLEESSAEVTAAFIAQRYLRSEATDLPRELVLSEAVEDAEALSEAIKQAQGRKLSISHRVRSHRAKWQQLALTAAEQNLSSRLASWQQYGARYQALQERLELAELPARMECFDISHSSGEATVASCVVFDGNGPLKADYRRFNISDIDAGDDYAAMRQALMRRYKRVQAGEVAMPDLLFIDGGKGQLNQAKEVMAELGIEWAAQGMLIIGVAKGSDRKAGLEVLIRGDNGREISLKNHDPALHLIQHIRDESHRFAVAGHKARRDKARRQSSLEAIPGVGAKRRRDLLKHFGGLQAIQQASVEDLSRVQGISQKLATEIYEALRSH